MTDRPDGTVGRRDLLRRGAMVGATLVWAVPVVQTLEGTALAAEVSDADVAPEKHGRSAVEATRLAGTGADGDLARTALVGAGLTAAGAAAVVASRVRTARRHRG